MCYVFITDNLFLGVGCDYYQNDLAVLDLNGRSRHWWRSPFLHLHVGRRETCTEANREGEDAKEE